MEGIAAEVSQKLKSAIKAKLMELGAYVDDELSNYVMVMVTNRRSKAEMDRELQLFLGGNTSAFTTWLQSVWMKLEQVTVTNSGIDSGKRKKKPKKGNKSSSDSEDDKKPKKKRKSSASEVTVKDVKKRKSLKLAVGSGIKAELVPEENSSDTPSTDQKSVAILNIKKNKNPVSSIDEDDFLSIKEDFESEFLSDNDSVDVPSRSKTSIAENTVKKSSLKSEFNEKQITVEQSADKRHFITKHSKESSETKEPSGRRVSPDNIKNISSSKVVLKSSAISDHRMSDDHAPVVSARKPLIRERKLCPQSRSTSPAKAAHSRSRSPAPISKSTSQRSRSRLRSRSPSASPSPPRTVKRSRGRDSGSPSRCPSTSRNLSTIVIKSRSRSPTSGKYTTISEKSANVVDARELINRKRAMVNANEQSSNVMEEKSLSKRPLIVRKHDIVDVDEIGKQRSAIARLKPPTDGIRLKSRERLKENVNVENTNIENVDDDDDDDDDNDDDNTRNDDNNETDRREDDDDAIYFEQNSKKAKNKYGRFVVSKHGGTRSVTMRLAVDKKATVAASKNDVPDLRGIRRTVYSDESTGEMVAYDGPEITSDDNVEENNVKTSKELKSRKSVMNQIVKYIKEDAPGNASSTKAVRLSRSKIGLVPSASSTLIRKAMADAHKSLNSAKEEASKKKEQFDGNLSGPNNRVTEEIIEPIDQDRSDIDEPVMVDENRISSDEMLPNQDAEYNPEDKIIERRDQDSAMDSTEEYDPSKNMPQFVVTLTGLDPKLFPNDDIEMADLDPMMDDIRLKSRSQERCKYYPNCLAADQCLYYHPVIPCKMFPNCKYGNNCLYIHPKCKFDSLCTRYDCTYLHSSPRVLPAAPARHPIASGGMNPLPCKYYFNCTNPVCPYQHPKICRYDRFCTNKNCTFSHTSLSHVGSHVNHYSVSKDKLKWCRPKENSDNKNGSVDTKMELDAGKEN